MSLQASIDIGTNTALLLVGETRDHQVSVIQEEQRVPRLGKGVDKDKYLTDEAISRVLDALFEYQVVLKREYPDITKVTVTATSAVRDATNREQFCKTVEKETGWPVRILSGSEEAEWTYAGALSVLDDLPVNDHGNMILDIGGGSTEIAYGKNLDLLDSHSFNIGCVRFTERYLKHDPPTPAEIEACNRAILDALDGRKIDNESGANAIGVSGTVTSLVFIELGMKEYDSEKINGYVLSKPVIKSFIGKFKKMSVEEMIERYPVVMTGRADIFIAGLLILEKFFEYFGHNKITVSTGGIRHGALLKG